MLTIAVTTAPRPDRIDYLSQSLTSLRRAKFKQPVHVFAEPGCAAHKLRDVQVHQAPTQQGCFQNWARAARWFVESAPTPWLLLLQDDCLWRNDAATVLEQAMQEFADNRKLGFLSPYTSKAMLAVSHRHAVMQNSSEELWCPARFHDNAFWGAVATLWTADSLRRVVEHSRFTGHTHVRKVDVVIGNCCRDMGLDILVRRPSLATHIGKKSTLGRDRIIGIQWGRYGFGFRPTR